jgi:hypothetical protein
LILREHHSEKIDIAELVEIQKRRVRAYLQATPNVAVRKVRDVAGLERSQARQHDITAVYRTMVGGLSADDVRRFSVFGKARTAALKERMDAIGIER